MDRALGVRQNLQSFNEKFFSKLVGRKGSRTKETEPQNIEQGITNIEGKKLHNSTFLV
jgi:hypothetical protein